MSLVKPQRPSPSRSMSSQSLGLAARPRRINVHLPDAEATTAAFRSPATGVSTLTADLAAHDRARYTMLVDKNTTSEALLKMPNVATKPDSVEGLDDNSNGISISNNNNNNNNNNSNSRSSTDINEGILPSSGSTITCNLPRTAPAPLSNLKLVIENQPALNAFPSGYQTHQ
ncbi:hypothetical protein BGZ98_001943, partial [Dissophora globulifera]